MFKNLIFDWSGTLVDDLALTLDASNYVFSQYGKPCMNRDEFRAEFQLPYPDYYARVLPQADLNELEDHFRYAFRVSTATVEVLPHAREFLEFCRARGVRCFILTSVDAKEFDIQCRELGMMEYFEAIHAGIRHKDTHIHTLLGQHGLHAHETAFIGDMQHDVETAHHAGITSIAVLTGYNDAAQLSRVKPDIITIILFNFLSFWNEYIISMTLMSSTSAPRTLPVGLLNLMQAQQSAAQYGTMYAGLVLVMLPTLILYICVQKQLTQGMTVGGLKG